MTELLTAAQMKAIETAAIESGDVTGLGLMERAGRGVVEAVFEQWPDLAAAPHKAVVLCGPGNNGGDGFVVARLLKEWGWEVEVFLYGDAGKLPPDAKVNYERWREMGEVQALQNDSLDNCDADKEALIVDAIFGTGIRRPFEALFELRTLINDFAGIFYQEGNALRVVSVDIPSGVCANSGIALGEDLPEECAIRANLTVSFHSYKTGHFLADAPFLCGKLKVADIGLRGRSGLSWIKSLNKFHGNNMDTLLHLKDVVSLSSGAVEFLSGKQINTHKYTHGHALILSGGAGKTGAARLAARGALRIGAGVVTLGVPPSAQMEVAMQITALMLKRVEDSAALAEVLKDKRITALCLGPGLGLERAHDLVPEAVRAEHTPYIVLDADALTAYAGKPQDLFDLLHQNCVLTPHAGEFARLFPDLSERLCEEPLKGPAYSKVDATRDAAKRAGCVVLYKGADTVIAAPNGRCSINSAHYERAAPWLATAGSGDVLAGFITGLMARGFGAMQAAETAAWLHVECARSFGPGLIAEDLAEELPKVFTALEL